MEKMTDKEKQILKELQAKAKRIEREKKKLMVEADQIKDELLERWGITESVPEVKEEKSDIWKEIYVAYGIDEEDLVGQEKLLSHLKSERQVGYYHKYAN